MTLRLPYLQLIFCLTLLCYIPLQQVLAQAETVTQIASFSADDDIQLMDVPLYGPSIVNHNFTDSKLEVVDLDGELRFEIAYGINLNVRSNFFSQFSFVGEPDRQNLSLVEVVFSMLDSDGNLILRKFNELGDLLVEEVIPDSAIPRPSPYMFVDPFTQHGFVAVEIFADRLDSVIAYPFSGAMSPIRIAGELYDEYPVYPSVPLIISQRDSLFVGYDDQLQVVAIASPQFGAQKMTVLSTDFRRDGILDAYSAIDTIINGEEATRIVFYDNTGYVYLDTFALGRISSFGSFYLTGLLPTDGGYHIANFTNSSNTDELDITFRSDTGELIDVNTFTPIFTLPVCLNGSEYLASIIPGWFIIDTLYNPQTGVAERSVPASFTYQGSDATFLTVVGQCDPTLPESIALVYDQANESKILFTDESTNVKAELAYEGFAFAFRFANNVYALSDVDEAGNPANTVYRIGEQISNTQQEVSSLESAIAPNPAEDYFQISIDENLLYSGLLDVKVYTLSGQEVAGYPSIEPNQAIKAPALSGMYVVQIQDLQTGVGVTKKLVVR